MVVKQTHHVCCVNGFQFDSHHMGLVPFILVVRVALFMDLVHYLRSSTFYREPITVVLACVM